MTDKLLRDQSRAVYTDGRYLLASTDARGSRDPIALTSQVKHMRTVFEEAGHVPVLMLVVVAEDEAYEACLRVSQALTGDAENPTREVL